MYEDAIKTYIVAISLTGLYSVADQYSSASTRELEQEDFTKRFVCKIASTARSSHMPNKSVDENHFESISCLKVLSTFPSEESPETKPMTLSPPA
jgi:hypothetical protein